MRILIVLCIMFTSCSSVKETGVFKTDFKVYFIDPDFQVIKREKLNKKNISIMFENEKLKIKNEKLYLTKNILQKNSVTLSFFHNQINIGSLNISREALLDGGEVYLGIINNYFYVNRLIVVDSDYNHLLMNSHKSYYTALTSSIYSDQFEKCNCNNLSYAYFHRKNTHGIYFGQKFKCENDFITPIY